MNFFQQTVQREFQSAFQLSSSHPYELCPILPSGMAERDKLRYPAA